MAQKFAVIGLGQYGRQVAISLGELGAEVMAIDRDPDVCATLRDARGVQAVCFDATDERALRAEHLDEVDAAVVASSSSLEVSIVVTTLLSELGVRTIVARARDPLHERILRSAGATLVHNPEVEMAIRDAQTLLAGRVRDRGELPTGHHAIELDAGEQQWGKTVGSLEFRERYEVNLIAIRRRVPYVDTAGEAGYRYEPRLMPMDADVVEEGDVLVLIGTERRTRELLSLWQ